MNITNFELGGLTFVKRAGSNASDISRYEADNTIIKLFKYPYCCTGVVLANFGESDDSYGGSLVASKQSLIDGISGWINELQSEDCRVAEDNHVQFISVCVTEQQVTAIEALKHIGFTLDSTHKNNKYHNDLLMFSISIND